MSQEQFQSNDRACETPFRYVHSSSFPALLDTLGVSLLVTTYQAGKLLAFRAAAGRMSLLPRTFEQAMGLAVRPDHIAVGTRYQIWIMRNDADIARQLAPAGLHDTCYLPRSSHVTGNIKVHELAWGDNELWVVNTLFSCLCTLDPNYSFVPRWRPHFVSVLAAEDRCHLNGLAVADGKPKYVTALAQSDVAEGWRPNKNETGCVIDVENNEVIARGLSMPHSPRVHAGRLWVLDSGTGRLVTIDPETCKIDAIAELPGYTRGLSFFDQYAFVGLSKIRETTTFGGVPIASERDKLKCGVAVIELVTRQLAALLEFDRSVTEIFDVAVLPGVRYPAIVGFQNDRVESTFVIPRDPKGH